MYSLANKRAPFRISSTPKGGEVYPGVYYLMEDVIAVNAGAGRPFREALAARYRASPRFRKMIRTQSIFWSVPSVILSIGLIVIVCIHPVPKDVAYGLGRLDLSSWPKSTSLTLILGWGVPFVFIGVWTAISIPWIKHDMHLETVTWEEDCGITPGTRSEEKALQLERGDSESTPPKDPIPERIPQLDGANDAHDARPDSETEQAHPQPQPEP
jgi:hypothetical protein